MLVLSRRLHEKIRFPELDATVEVLSIRPGTVRLGIDAPPEINVLRAEVPDRAVTWGASDTKVDPALASHLQSAGLAVGLARFQLRTGQTQELQATLDKLQEQIQALRKDAGHQPVPAMQRRCLGHRETANEMLAGHLD